MFLFIILTPYLGQYDKHIFSNHFSLLWTGFFLNIQIYLIHPKGFLFERKIVKCVSYELKLLIHFLFSKTIMEY